MNVSVEGYMRKEETEEEARVDRKGQELFRVQSSLVGEFV